MSQLSVKYSDPDNSEKFYFFTRDIEYKKVTVYQDGKIIKTISNIDEFEQGIQFEDGLGQKVSLKLLNKGNFSISVLVDGVLYTPVINTQRNYKKRDVRSIAVLFAIALAVQLLNFMYFSENEYLIKSRFTSESTFQVYRFDIMTIPVIIYSIVIYFLHENRGWAYFFGLPVLLLFNCTEIYNYFIFTSKWWLEYPLIIELSIGARLILVIILLSKIGWVLRNLKNAGTAYSDEVLD